jgi:predicted nucleic acid-binding protein
MFLLDTNVISELRKVPSGRADLQVVAWTQKTSPSDQFISTITAMELEIGVRRIERRDVSQGVLLRRWFEEKVLPQFSGRLLPVDLQVAVRCAALHVPDRREEGDAMIAATALVHGLTVVTRNTRDFAPMGVPLLNPWEPAA